MNSAPWSGTARRPPTRFCWLTGPEPENAHQFVLHHIIRRSDKHDPNYHQRDEVQHLRLLWNGTTGLGAAGCHGETHRNQDRSRRLGLLAERKLADVIPFPNFQRPVKLVEHQGHQIPQSTLAHQPDGGAASDRISCDECEANYETRRGGDVYFTGYFGENDDEVRP